MRQHTFLASTLYVAVGWGLLAVGPAQAQLPPDLRGNYRGFSQSMGNPNLRGPVQLTIDFEDFTKGAFSGQLTMADQPFPFSGKVDMFGRFKGSGRSTIGMVKFDGKFDDQGGGGALVRFMYLFTYPTGATDQGDGKLVRNFQAPPDPDQPPNISGDWEGPYHSDLAGGMGRLNLMVQQDLDIYTKGPGTGFSGQEVVDRCTARSLTFDFVGTVNGDGRVLVVGLGMAGQFLVGGMVGGQAPPDGDQPPPDPDRGRFTYLLNFFDQGIDLGTFMVNKLEIPPDPCSTP